MKKSYLVTGGSGFLGSALVRRLVYDGCRVRVLDNNFRGRPERLKDIEGDFEFVEADIRDPAAVLDACKGMEAVCHLAYINGTEFFYQMPELVLEIAVSGMMNVLNGCIKTGIGELILASSSEVYQTPTTIPTDELAPLSVPDPRNPRYSYGGGKIISELLALNYGRRYFERVLVFRPHNVYGPDMGWEHVVPQFVVRMKELSARADGPVPFPIQGSGRETRAFVYVDDFTDGLALLLEKGEHLEIYNIGTQEEITVADVAQEVARYFGRAITILPGRLQPGGTPRRCPDITKISRLGYRPLTPFSIGLPYAAEWYDKNSHLYPGKDTA